MTLDQILIDIAIRLAHKALYTTDCVGHPPYGVTQYQASKVTTRLYASQGPKDIFAVEHFKSFIEECNIKNIVAIGLDRDFNNYGYCKSESDRTSLTEGETYALQAKSFPAGVQGTLFAIRDGQFLDGKNRSFINELLNSYVRSLASPTRQLELLKSISSNLLQRNIYTFCNEVVIICGHR